MDLSSESATIAQDIDGSRVPVNEITEYVTNETEESSRDGTLTPLSGSEGEPTVTARTYQLEMLEESLKKNIIVAMDTGSGKTHIAVMRMLHELENSGSTQLIWFLAPTVSLCHQQFLYMQKQIATVQIKFLSGADNVERWTNQFHWDGVLKNVRIVVSPYQILLEALSHGFVQMSSLSMIVFDEAHNCVGKHPGAVLMKNFYHENKVKGFLIPKILGLTASPVMRSNPASVSKIEQTLDAICRTPKKHRAELRLHVRLPALLQVHFESPLPLALMSLTSLAEAYRGMKLTEDPYYLSLKKEKSERAQRSLDKLILSQKTWSRDQMKSFLIIAQRIGEELGEWAADYYVSQVVSKILSTMNDANNEFGSGDVSWAEKLYIAKSLQTVRMTHPIAKIGVLSVSDKVTKLIDVLEHESGRASGIIFVKERATAFMLAKLLIYHPRTQNKFRVGTVLGTSQHSKRTKSISELLDVSSSEDALSKFRNGELDLVIATSVLEEGLDVPECNLVVCFEKPANLKSWVQRRGRARHQDSKLILLLDTNVDRLQEWAKLEADMKAIYEDEMRVLKEIIEEEDTEEHDGRTFQVESTNATIDLDSAMGHLHHFCTVLPATDYVDRRPEFVCTWEAKRVCAKVILPISVNETLRVATSLNTWRSEKNACKDAAFQAYVALYRAGLVNDNLLPLLRRDEVVDAMMTTAVETRASLMDVQLNSWIWTEIAQLWGVTSKVYSCDVDFGGRSFQLYLPVPIPHVQPFKIFWDSQIELMISPGTSTSADFSQLERATDDTWALLQAAFGVRFTVKRKDIVMRFLAKDSAPLQSYFGQSPATGQSTQALSTSGLIRDSLDPNVAYIFQQLLPTKPDSQNVQQPYDDYGAVPTNTPHIAVKRVQKRMDFLHKISSGDQQTSTKPYSVVLPVSRCTVDTMPLAFVQFGQLIPSIMRRYEIYLIAQQLSNKILESVMIDDLSLIVTAICSSNAVEESNYQRLEFLGDSTLKLCTSIQVSAMYPLWPEGYLSSAKDRLVANSRLARAAVEIGLDKYIINKSFTGLKWRPPYVEDLAKMTNEGTRQMSSKVLADVVEALVGAAMVDGGLPKALACLQVFLSELQWQPLSQRRDFLNDRVPDTDLPSTLLPLETLLGYKFTRPGLLKEAITHPSSNTGSSFDRLEFLGDSILDYIIVQEMYKHDLTHVQMHLLRTALVNADVLAFICMEWSTSQESVHLTTPSDPALPITKTSTNIEMPLWRFMRHTSQDLAAMQVATAIRHRELRPQILAAIEHGSLYPWALLARLEAKKFYSDLIEALIGAVWIDSGSFDVCRALVERMGILNYMNRILEEGVHVWHPKEELGRLADTEKVKYVLDKTKGVGKYVCTVFVGEERVVSVDGGVSELEIKTRAAAEAVAILGKRKEKGVDKGQMGLGEDGRREVVECDEDEESGVDLLMAD